MLIANRVLIRSVIAAVFTACAFVAALPCAEAQSQTTQPAQAQATQSPEVYGRQYGAVSVADAVAKVQSGEFGLVFVDVSAQAHAVEAIPALKKQFGRSQDWMQKAKIAAALLRLGEHDDAYWDYLVKEAKVALDSDAPNFFAYDAEGKSVDVSPEFEDWLATRNPPIEPSEAYQNSRYMDPIRVMMLGWSEDPRAIPYLRQALTSRNEMIQITAASGLAQIGDDASVPLIISACEKASKDGQMSIAESLVFFDSDAAQKTVDIYVPAEVARYQREEKASGRRTKPFDTDRDPSPNQP